MSDQNTETRSTPAILQGTFGGVSIGSIFLVLLGLFGIIMQVVVLLAWEEEIPMRPSTFAPGIIGLLLIGIFAVTALNRGKFALYPHRITGRKKFGGKFSIDFTPEMQLNLLSANFHLQDAAGTTLLLQPSPRPRSVRGWVWLMLQYPWLAESGWLSGVDIWALPDHESIQTGIRRDFMEGEEAIFHDGGFIFPIGEGGFYFPFSTTYQLPQNLQSYNSINRSLRLQEPFLHFEPNPATLPMVDLLTIILQSSHSEQEKLQRIQELAENHGGTYLEVADMDAKKWQGTCRDYPVIMQVFTNERT